MSAKFQEEFPDFPAEDMPTIPEGFADSSWHNDVCPSFRNLDKRLGIFVDYKNAASREMQGGSRFTLHRTDECGLATDVLCESDDWNEILNALKGL